MQNILGSLYDAYQKNAKFSYTLHKMGYDFLTANDARSRYYRQAVIAGIIPAYGAVLRANDAVEEMDRTLALYGLTYDDITYTTYTKAFGSVGSAAGQTLNYVSSNINRLYK